MPVTALSYVTVTGNFQRLDGTAAEGLIEFYTDVQLVNTVTNQTVVPGTTSARLVAGAFTVSLPCTNDGDFSPTGWTYEVREVVDDVVRRYSIALPASPSTVDLADAVPANPVIVYPDFVEAVQDIIGALTGFGGTGLTFSYNDAGDIVALVVNVDGASLEINADILRIKAAGVLPAMLDASLPRGLVTPPVFKTSNQTGITTEADITGLVTASFTAVAGRTYKITEYHGSMLSTVANDTFETRIKIGSTQLQRNSHFVTNTGAEGGPTIFIGTLTPGATVVKVTMARTLGTGSGTYECSATSPASLTVEDIGPG